MKDAAFDTRAVHAAISPDSAAGAILPPIYQSTTFVPEEVGRDKGFDYTRAANPTRQILEEHLAALEGGRHGVLFGSGMAAVDAIFRRLVPGDHVVSSKDIYGGVFRYFERILVNGGIDVGYVDSASPQAVREALRPKTRILWIETPSNPLLTLTDIEAMATIAREAGIILAVDSTFATPMFLRPLEMGADIVMHSTTKYLSGHNHVVGGVLITSCDDLAKQLRFIQKVVGAVPSPIDCWLTLLGTRTLHLRMPRHSSNARAVAEFLQGHPKVERVLWPGLPSHPQHALACERMSGFGGMLSFELAGGIESGRILMNAVSLIRLAESLGAVESMITHPATMTHVDVPSAERRARGLSDGLVRLSVGIEDARDIIADLEGALAKVP